MNKALQWTFVAVSMSVSAFGLPRGADAQWYAGVWDSSLGGGMGHPATIMFRFEVEDAASGVPIEGAEVRLDGQYEDHSGWFPRNRDFRLSASTNRDGVAVVALSWHTHSPYEVQVDDIEKVQRVSVRFRRYDMFESRFEWSYLIGDDQAYWTLLLETTGARYFFLQPGSDYRHYNEEASTDPLLFEKVRDRVFDLDVTPTSPQSPIVTPFLSNPQAEAGPYLMIPYSVKLTCRGGRGCH